MNNRIIADSELWMMSFYRTSEIAGAEFFGRIAKYLPAGELQSNMTKHFADESNHAWYWTKTIEDMGYGAERISKTYQDSYLDAAGLPVNMMEILAISNVFEKRAAHFYNIHLKMNNLATPIQATIKNILVDEGWHIKWINQALKEYEATYGKEKIQATLKRYQQADDEIFGKMRVEYKERLDFIMEQ